MKVYTDESYKVPIKSWCGAPEEGALSQAANLARLPFAFHHVALMPDTHQGYGMPIGGVLATQKVVIPNAVGVDIGCGMCAVETNHPVSSLTPEILKEIIGEARKRIPVGFAHQPTLQPSDSIPPLDDKFLHLISEKDALGMVGTLGGGNHFIEVQSDEGGMVWVMIHSGSRGLGKKVADYFNTIARDLNELYFSQVPRSADLAFLPILSEEAFGYLTHMRYCVDFALANRRHMLNTMKDILGTKLGCNFLSEVNIAHNYAESEYHFGQKVMVHRKGATSAKEGEVGLIPGSQGTASYVVQGKGNPESFSSCSHGAGRKMGRAQAQRELILEDEIKKLEEKGVVHSVRTVKDLDEAPSAYKDIDVVMEEQKDLVDILYKLKPLAVVKG